MRKIELVAAMLVIAVTAGVSAIGQEPYSYAKDVRPIFAKECSDCHGADRPKKGLNLLDDKAVEALVNRPSQEVPEIVLVKPGEPNTSYLWQKLTHTAKEGKGMPRTIFSAKMLPQGELEIVEKWIQAGAKP